MSEPADHYFIRYLPGAERPYRLYYWVPAGFIKRTRGRGHTTPEAAVEHLGRLLEHDAKLRAEREAA